MPRVVIKKYNGNDSESWAIFVDGKPVLTGLARRETEYYRRQVEDSIKRGASPKAIWPLGEGEEPDEEREVRDGVS